MVVIGGPRRRKTREDVVLLQRDDKEDQQLKTTSIIGVISTLASCESRFSFIGSLLSQACFVVVV